jgi:1,4-alpha-glucan branching enzyme
LMTAFGLPFIWMGEEFGEFKEKRPDQNKLEWHLLADEHNQGLLAHYKTLIALRKSAPALRSENIVFFYEDIEHKVLAYYRWSGEESHVVVIANLSGEPLGSYPVPNFPHDGTWHEWLTNHDVEVDDNQLTLDLPAREAQVFVRNG